MTEVLPPETKAELSIPSLEIAGVTPSALDSMPVPIDIRAFIKEQDSQSAARAVSDAQSRLNEAKTKLEAVKA